MPSERAFLDLQSAAAKARLRHEANALAADLIAPLRLQPLVRRHPWLSLGGAALAGFLATGGIGGTATAAGPKPAKELPASVAALLRRVRRMMTGAIGTVVLSSLRGRTRAATPVEEPAASDAG